MAAVELGADWLLISDSQRSLGTVQVNLWAPNGKGSELSEPPKESTVFEVRTLAVLRTAVMQWGSDGNSMVALAASVPRALWGVGDAGAIAERLTCQDGSRCSGRVAFRRSLGMVAAELWDRLHGKPGPINDSPQLIGRLTCSLKFTPPMGSNSWPVVNELWKGRNG